MDSSESATNQSTMTFGNNSSCGERPVGAPAAPASADVDISNEEMSSESEQEFGSSCAARRSTRVRKQSVSSGKRDARVSNRKGRAVTPRGVPSQKSPQGKTADARLDSLIRATRAAVPAARSPRGAAKPIKPLVKSKSLPDISSSDVRVFSD